MENYKHNDLHAEDKCISQDYQDFLKLPLHLLFEMVTQHETLRCLTDPIDHVPSK